MNIGNPVEMTVLEFAERDHRATGSKSDDRLRAAAAGRPEGAAARHREGAARAGVGAEGGAGGWVGQDHRVVSRASGPRT